MDQTGILHLMRRLFRHRGGVVGIMFGVIYGPITGMALMGLATAVQTVNQQRALALLDTALIAVAATPKSAINPSGTLTTAQIQTAQNGILQAYWTGNGGTSVCGSGTPTLSFPSSTVIGATVTCTATSGTASTNYTATSQVSLQGYNVEVAMVLDNTGSMSSAVTSTGAAVNATTATPTKITGLKQGALSFLNILKTATNGPGVIKVGMTPFTTDVNIVNPGDPMQAGVQIGNSAATQASYVNFSPQVYSTPVTYSLKNGCVKGTTGLNVPTINLIYTSIVTNTSPCGQYYYTMPAIYDSTTWSGCVIDRDQADTPVSGAGIDYSVSNAFPTAGAASLYPADNINCGDYKVGPLSVVPLVDIYNATNFQLLTERLLCRPDDDYVNANANKGIPAYSCNPASPPAGWLDICTIGSLSCNSGTGSVTINGIASNKTGMLSNGSTDLTIGLAWGWNMLTPSFPMYPAANRAVGGSQIKQFLVFFTDGQNTQNRFMATSKYVDSTNIDNETKAICNNIKAAGITIFTIGTGDADTSTLNYCASPGDAYTGVASDKIRGVFEDIAGQISSLRVIQ